MPARPWVRLDLAIACAASGALFEAGVTPEVYGELIRSEADFQLQVIYLLYEHNVPEALSLLRGLRARRPHNPLFLQLIAETEDTYLHDITGSLRSWQALLDAARAGTVARADIAEVRARLGMALQLDRLAEADAAVEQLRAVIDIAITALP